MNEGGKHGADDDRRGGGGLRVVGATPAPQEPPPPVRLVREWKGPTVADLLRDEYAARLPGQVRSALRHLEAGDLAAAEADLPGDFAPILPGPAGRRQRRARRLAAWLAGALAALAAAALAWRGGW